jgi:transposase
LDAIAEQSEHIIGSVGAAAFEAFGIDVTRLHWDLTSISLYGSHEDSDPAYPAPAYGHPKDRRTDLRQIQAGIAVSGDGGIPVWHRAYDGGAGQVAQVLDAMGRLTILAGPRGFLLVGDSKLISYGNVTAMTNGEVTFIAPLAAARVPAGLFAGLDRSAATVVDYIADRDSDKPPWQRCHYRSPKT